MKRIEQSKQSNVNHLRDVDVLQIPRYHEDYNIEIALDAVEENELAHVAQRLHGSSYVEAGYFKPEALDSDGRLYPELDGTRAKGDGRVIIDYLVARHNKTQEAGASVRLIHIGDIGELEDLPTYGYFKDTFSPEIVMSLNQLVIDNGPDAITEIAALSNAGKEHRTASYELMRSIVQSTVMQRARTGYSGLHIASLTRTSLGPIERFTGPAAIKIIGDPVQIFSDDSRANNILVRPVLIDCYKIVEQLAEAIELSDGQPNKDIVANIHFLLEGLTPSQMGERLANVLEELSFPHSPVSLAD